MAQLLPRSPSALRHVSPENTHITLAFLGQVADERVGAACDAVRDAAKQAEPFRVTLEGPGHFGGTVWLGVGEGASDLVALSESLRAALVARAVPFDPRPFRPHLTLARLRSGARASEARAALTGLRPEPLRFVARSLDLMRSTLSPRGARYDPIELVPIGTGEAGDVDRGRGEDP